MAHKGYRGRRRARRSRRYRCVAKKSGGGGKGTWGREGDDGVICTDIVDAFDGDALRSPRKPPGETAWQDTSNGLGTWAPGETDVHPCRIAQLKRPTAETNIAETRSGLVLFLRPVPPPPVFGEDPSFRAVQRLVSKWLNLSTNIRIIGRGGQALTAEEGIRFPTSQNPAAYVGCYEAIMPKHLREHATFDDCVPAQAYWHHNVHMYSSFRRSSDSGEDEVTYSGRSLDREYIFFDRFDPGQDAGGEAWVDSNSCLRLCVNEVGMPSGMVQESLLGDAVVRTGGDLDYRVLAVESERLQVPALWQKLSRDADIVRETERVSYRRSDSLWTVSLVTYRTFAGSPTGRGGIIAGSVDPNCTFRDGLIAPHTPDRTPSTPPSSGTCSQRTPEATQRTLDSPQRTLESPQRPSQRTVESPQRLTESPQRSFESPQRNTESPQRHAESPQRALESPLRTPEPSQRTPEAPQRTPQRNSGVPPSPSTPGTPEIRMDTPMFVEHGFEVECNDVPRLQHYAWCNPDMYRERLLFLVLTLRALIHPSSS
eukprot:Rmarinus@m.24777